MLRDWQQEAMRLAAEAFGTDRFSVEVEIPKGLIESPANHPT